MKVTNNSKALQGVRDDKGRAVYIRPESSREVELSGDALKRAKRLSFLSFEGKSTKADDKPRGNEGGQTGPEAKHRGGGSYSIMEGDDELREKLTKDQAEAFNALDVEGKAKWLAENPKPAE